MNFDTKLGNFFKTNNYTPQIIKKVLLTLVIVYAIYVYYYGISYIISSIINIIVISVVNIFVKFLHYKIIKKEEGIFSIILNDYTLVNGIILAIILPRSISISITIGITLFSSILLLILEEFVDIKINYVAFTFLLFIISLNLIININQEINIFIILIFIMINAFLSINDCIKIDITLRYILGIIVLITLYSCINDFNVLNNLKNIFLLPNLVFATYIINDNKTTPVIPISKIIYVIVITVSSILSITNKKIYIVLVSIVLYNVLSQIIDNIVLKMNKMKK